MVPAQTKPGASTHVEPFAGSRVCTVGVSSLLARPVAQGVIHRCRGAGLYACICTSCGQSPDLVEGEIVRYSHTHCRKQFWTDSVIFGHRSKKKTIVLTLRTTENGMWIPEYAHDHEPPARSSPRTPLCGSHCLTERGTRVVDPSTPHFVHAWHRGWQRTYCLHATVHVRRQCLPHI